MKRTNLTWRILCLALCVGMLIPLFGCSKEEPNGENNGSDSRNQSTESEAVSEEVGGTESESNAEAEPEEPLPQETTAKNLTSCLYLFEGESADLSYVSRDAAKSVLWKSDSDCVEVRDGRVTAKKEGSARIFAGEDSYCSVRVLGAEMPKLYVSTYGAPITNKEDYVSCDVSLSSSNEDLGFWCEEAGIRLRGNSTMNTPKKPYRIKFKSKINLLGMNDGAKCKSWVLLADWFDDSMIRNTTALSLAQSVLSEYASDWRYVRLMLNGEDQGVYILAEQSQINQYRINIEEAGEDTPELRSGYLYEVEGSRVDEGKYYVSYEELDIYDFLGEKYTVQSTDIQEDGKRRSGIFLELKNDNTSDGQKAFAEKYAQNIVTLIYSATYEGICYEMDDDLNLIRRDDLTPQEAISAAVDLDSMARMYLVNELICNFDSFKKSSYFYVDFSEGGTGKLTFTCPWDHDRAFVKSWDSIEPVDYDAYFTARRSLFYVMMMNHDFFRQTVGEIWQEVYANSQAFRNTREMIGKISDRYAEDFAEEAELWDRKHAQKSWALQTNDWLGLRIEWLNTQFSAMASAER